MSRPRTEIGRPIAAATAVVVRGSAVNLVAMVTGAAVSFVLVAVVSRLLQPRGAGAFFQLVALFTILSSTFKLGADTGLTRWISRARAIGGMEHVRRMIAIATVPVVLIGAGVAVAMWITAPQLAHIFLHGLDPATEAAEIRLIAPIVPLGSLSAVVVGGARGFGRMWPYLVIVGLGQPVVRLLLVAGVLMAGLGLEAAVVVWSLPVLAGLVVGCLILAGILHKEVPARAARDEARAARDEATDPPQGRGEARPDRRQGGEDARPDRRHVRAAAEADASGPAQARRRQENRADGWQSRTAVTPADLEATAVTLRPRRTERTQFPVIPELDATLELPVVVDPVVPYRERDASADDTRERGRHRSETRLLDETTRHLAVEFWRFTGPRAVQATFQVIVLWLDVLIVGALTDSYQAGVYNAVSRLAIAGTFALEAIRLAIGPQLSGMLAKRQHDRAADLYQSATRWLILASWPLYLVFATFPALTLGIFGPKYEAGAWALAALALAMLVNLGTGNVTVVLLMGGKSSWSAFNATGALVVNIGLNLLLVPHIGILGASIAWSASIVVDNIAAIVAIRLAMKLAPFGPGYWTAAAMTLVCFGGPGLAARLLFGQTGPALGVALSAGLPAFVLALYAARVPLQLTGLAALVRSRAGAGRPASAQPSPEPLPAIAAVAGTTTASPAEPGSQAAVTARLLRPDQLPTQGAGGPSAGHLARRAPPGLAEPDRADRHGLRREASEG